MTTLFAKTFRQALRTFDVANKNYFQANFDFLKELVEELTIQDLVINENLISDDAFSSTNKAPCTYVHIYENHDVTMSVFILKSSYEMPLHDHPGMHGILKVISGSVVINSYSECETFSNYDGTDSEYQSESESDNDIDKINYKNVIKEQPKILNRNDYSILTPDKCNFHEIKSINGAAAFFDILSPPYDDIYRKCNFYRKFVLDTKPNLFLLKQIATPSTYYCDSVKYVKPKWLTRYNDDIAESD